MLCFVAVPSTAMEVAFRAKKQALLSATHLAHPTVGADLSLVVDALATHLGGYLIYLSKKNIRDKPMRIWIRNMAFIPSKFVDFADWDTKEICALIIKVELRFAKWHTAKICEFAIAV